MAFIGVKLIAGCDKEALAMKLESFIARRADTYNCIVVDERNSEKGELADLLSILSVNVTDFLYLQEEANNLDMEILSHSLGRGKWGDLILMDSGNGVDVNVVRSDLMLNLLYVANYSTKSGPARTESFLSIIKKMLGQLGASSGTSISDELRSILIGLENVFKFLDIRSCTSACQVGDLSLGLSRSILAAAAFAKKLEVSGSRSFPAVSKCIQHLQDGKAIWSHFNSMPVSATDYIFFRKAYVWIASLHMAHAKFLSVRLGYSNSAIHHCVRAIEAYLVGILVPAKKIFPKSDMSFWTTSKKILGVGPLLKYSPVPVPQDVTDLLGLRNNSELAHGVYRWEVSVSERSVLAVESFLLSLDSTHSDGDLFRHLSNANSVDLAVLARDWASSFIAGISKHVEHVVLNKEAA
ncbi:hypothetical protein [Pseudomonas sp.]|uniref:hypothetical protein n=1 Tax=Pseudomonas sp. TaxID=306 RepID=UPI0033400367